MLSELQKADSNIAFRIHINYFDEDVDWEKDKTVKPLAGLLDVENHYYCNCNIFRKIHFPVHTHNTVEL